MNHELDFWKRFIHSQQFKTWTNDGKTPELDSYVYQFLISNKGSVLDVGSGVVSVLNGTCDNLTCCDVLADKYAEIYDYKKEGFIKPDQCSGESLTYENETFDISHIRNAIDHCVDPVDVYNEMVRVTKKGGHVIIQGFENEADHERFAGFHQWNMKLERGHLKFEGKQSIRVIERKPIYSSIQQTATKRNWITWIAKI